MSGQKFGERWEIVKQIGEGGQGHVFEVRDIRGEAPNSVLKRLKNLKRLERFKTELEAIQRLQHPNIIRCVDHDLAAEKPYIVVELIPGGTLAEHISRFSADPVRALEVFTDICEAVAMAHENGIVHRDLKPENILLRTTDGPAVVSDFGICFIEENERQTLTEEAVGPRLYMAPELEDGRVDHVPSASDVYSLGKLLYSIVSGRSRPFSREQHREDSFELVRMTNNAALEHVNRLLDRMVVAEPGSRFRDARAVLDEVRKTLRLLRGNYRALGPKIPQHCMVCGEGTYKLTAHGHHSSVENFGLRVVGSPDWRAFVCDECGHVALFRLDYARRKEWWR